MREVNIQDEDENVDLESIRKAHLVGSQQNNQRTLVFKQKEIKFRNVLKDQTEIDGRSVNSKLNYVNDYQNQESFANSNG
jgi:hypothetical protein